MIRLIVADDHAIVRAGLLHVFSLLPDMQVVGEADGYAAIQRLLREVEVDVLLLDVSMPGISGVDCVSRLKHEFPGLRILNLTMHHNAELAKRLLDNGALGYVTKSAESACWWRLSMPYMPADAFATPACAVNWML